MARRRGIDEEIFEERNPLSFAERLTEGTVQANPLMMGRPGLYEQYTEESPSSALAGISPEVAAANPLLRPPRPIHYMPVEQQILWSERQAEALKNQANLQAVLNNNTKTAREAELEIQRRAQSTKIIDALGELDPASDDYLDRKSRLFSSNPIGATSDEVQALFGVKDKAWQLREEQRKGERERRAVTEEALRKEAISQAKKDAFDFGDSAFMEEVNKDLAQDPDIALRKVAKKKNDVQGQSLNIQLQQYGVPEDEIKRLYHDPVTNLYRVDAAVARLKIEEARRAAGEKIASESQVATIATNLAEEKRTTELQGGVFSPEREAALKYYQDRLVAFAQVPGRTAVPAKTKVIPPEGSTAIDPAGRKQIVRNGKWEPL